MSTSDHSWKTRYYELENTLEQILTAFQAVLTEHETNNSSQKSQCAIRRVTRTSMGDTEFLCCVADGENMEFSFEFFNQETPLSKVTFQRMNAVPLPSGLAVGSAKCLVTARSNGSSGPSTASREVKL